MSKKFTLSFDELEELKGANIRQLDHEHVDNLARSILEVGLVEPISVFECEGPLGLERHLLSGFHRVAALKKIFQEHKHIQIMIPAKIIRGEIEELSEYKTLLQQVMPNLLRKDMNIFDRSKAFKKMVDLHQDIQRVASAVGRSSRSIQQHLQVACFSDCEIATLARANLKDRQVFNLAAKRARNPDQFNLDQELVSKKSEKSRKSISLDKLPSIDIAKSKDSYLRMRLVEFLPLDLVEKVMGIVNEASSRDLNPSSPKQSDKLRARYSHARSEIPLPPLFKK